MANTIQPYNRPFVAAPDDPFPKECLYAVEFTDGVVKVGRTYQPRTRLTKLSDTSRQRGRYIARFHFTSPVSRGCKAESDLVSRLSRIAQPVIGCREYFTNVQFEVACQLCDQVAEQAEG